MEQYRFYGRNQGMPNRNMCGCESNRKQAPNPCGCESGKMQAYNTCGCESGKMQTFNTCGCESGKMQAYDTCGCESSVHEMKEHTCKEEHCCHIKPIGMAYVPMQAWEKMYDKKTALVQGTAFPSLNLIFCGVRGKM